MHSAGNDVVAFRLTDPERSAQPRFYNQILSPSEIALFHSGALPSLSFHIFLWLCWSIKESAYKFRKRYHPDLVFSPTAIPVTEIRATAQQITHEGPQNASTDPQITGTDHQITHPVLQITGTDHQITHPVLLITNAAHQITHPVHVITGRTEDLFFRSELFPEGIHTVVYRHPDFKSVRSGYAFLQQALGSNHPQTNGATEPTPETQSAAVRELVLLDLRKRDPNGAWSFGKHKEGYPLLYRNGVLQPVPLSLAHHDQLLGFSYLLPVS